MSQPKKSNEPKKFKLDRQMVARFTVCCEPDVFNRLTTLAHRRNMGRSELVREIVVEYLTLVSPPRRAHQERANA